ncbi:MAG TPA: hypothetical protein VKK30_05645, partial [Actinomycetota bacterium]|nr:hypothetical protein [Actinomycetota bacterium]
MRRAILAALALTALVTVPTGSAGAGRPVRPRIPTNVDVSRRHNNESEEAVAVNPTKPKNIVIVTNVDVPLTGMFEGVSFDGGQTWATKLIGNNDNLGDACCDPSLSFDSYGNLFMTYLYNTEVQVPIALSTDGGLHFNLIANLGGPRKSIGSRRQEPRGLFRFTDQPTIT